MFGVRCRPCGRKAFVVAVLALSVVPAGCGSSNGETSAESPQAALEEATLRGIESGKLNLALELRAPGPEGGTVQAQLSGAFQGQGKGELPKLAMTAKINGDYNGREIAFDGGLTVRPPDAYVDYEGTAYEVDATTLDLVESALEQTQDGRPSAGVAGGCQDELGRLSFADFLEDGRNEGSAVVGGAHTTRFSGKLNVSGAVHSLLEALESPNCRSWLAAAGLLPSRSEIEAAESQVSNTANTPRVSVYIDKDNIVRRISAALTIEPHRGSKGGPKRIAVNFNLELTGINEEHAFSVLRSSEPLTELLAKLHVNQIRLLRVLQGEEHGESLGDLLLP
jgi:hypothetical protein